MCRRCGEPDKRGSSTNRRRRKQYLLDTYGDGTTVRCHLCPTILTFETVESDRLIPGCMGGTYRRENIRPCCGPCNKGRAYPEILEGCAYG